MNTFVCILIFSLVETVAVVLWIALAGFKTGANTNTQIAAAIVLFVFYIVEHIIAFNVGKGRPLLSFPKP